MAASYVEFATLPGAVWVAFYGRGALAQHAGVSPDGTYIDASQRNGGQPCRVTSKEPTRDWLLTPAALEAQG